ncbi:MAG: hypothetical protein MZU97_06500 [Bacillus subtilis]|nr:hypothetical protein [Bacillus subtilis]
MNAMLSDAFAITRSVLFRQNHRRCLIDSRQRVLSCLGAGMKKRVRATATGVKASKATFSAWSDASLWTSSGGMRRPPKHLSTARPHAGFFDLDRFPDISMEDGFRRDDVANVGKSGPGGAAWTFSVCLTRCLQGLEATRL